MTKTERWIRDDNPLFDITADQLIGMLIDEGHNPNKAIKMVNDLVPNSVLLENINPKDQ